MVRRKSLFKSELNDKIENDRIKDFHPESRPLRRLTFKKCLSAHSIFLRNLIWWEKGATLSLTHTFTMAGVRRSCLSITKTYVLEFTGLLIQKIAFSEWVGIPMGSWCISNEQNVDQVYVNWCLDTLRWTCGKILVGWTCISRYLDLTFNFKYLDEEFVSPHFMKRIEKHVTQMQSRTAEWRLFDMTAPRAPELNFKSNW